MTGHSGAGKTTLARTLSRELGLMCIHKDDIKETIGDEFAPADRAESRRFGKAAYNVMDRLMERALESGNSLIVESNFPAEFYDAKIAALKDRFGFQIVQVLCWATPDVLIERTNERVAKGERHPVHSPVPDVDTPGYRAYLGDGRLQPLKVVGEIVEIDTTTAHNVAIMDEIRCLISE